MQDRDLPAIKPLTARSVVLSTLLGYHPPAMPVSGLVRVGALFGIAERTTRVALTRLAADGDVAAGNGVYRLTERLLRRQAQQDEASSPRLKQWTGTWEMAIITAPARPLPERVALRKGMTGFRLAELREGVWIRPDNLLRPLDGPIAAQCALFEARYPDPAALAASLWDLPAWASEARRLSTELSGAASLTGGFMVIAEVVRHLRSDPCLPPDLLPASWPAPDLRDRFTEFRSAYAHRLRAYSQALRSASTLRTPPECGRPVLSNRRDHSRPWPGRPNHEKQRAGPVSRRGRGIHSEWCERAAYQRC